MSASWGVALAAVGVLMTFTANLVTVVWFARGLKGKVDDVADRLNREVGKIEAALDRLTDRIESALERSAKRDQRLVRIETMLDIEHKGVVGHGGEQRA